jgi:cell shape-determining protein MreC
VTPVTGDGEGSLIVTVAKAHAIRPGDSLVSRTDEKFLPAEIAIGKVVVVEPDKDKPGFSKLVIKPDADLAALREVYIVVRRGTPIPTATEGKRR